MQDENTRIFEKHRPTIEGMAYRMLGSLAEASDVVQDTYLRWREVNINDIENARAWLITTCSRLAINSLNSARVRREQYYGLWLPEPYVESTDVDSSDQLEIDESVSVALLMILERLSPQERAAYILREVFAFSFEEIAQVLGKRSDNCRQLVSRARKNIQSKQPRFEASSHEHTQLLQSFVDAAESGDMGQFEQVLTTSVKLYADGGGKAPTINQTISGTEVIGKFFTGIWRQYGSDNTQVDVSIVWFNGCPGLLIYEDGELSTAINIEVENKKISALYAIRNPDKLAYLL